MPKLKQPELTIWNLYVQACGGKCCGDGCKHPNKPLERGHLQRHAAGGGTDWTNLIPLCHPCNVSVKYGTKDTRPANWRDNFVKLIASELGVGFRVRNVGADPSGSGQTRLGRIGSQVIENTKVLDWQNVEFVAANVVWADKIESGQTPKPMGDLEARNLVQEIAYNAKRDLKIPLPTDRREEQLVKIAKRIGSADYKLAAKEYLRDYDASIYEEPWLALCRYEAKYLEAGCARVAAEAKAAAKRREAFVDQQRAETSATETARQFAVSQQKLHDNVRNCLLNVQQMEDFNNKDLFVEQLNALLENATKARNVSMVDRYTEQLDQIQQGVANETGPAVDFMDMA